MRKLLEEDETGVPVVKEESSKIETEEFATKIGVPTQMETNFKVDAPKKKVKKTNVPISEVVYGGLVVAHVQKAVEKELEMNLKDRIMEENKKNDVQAYVYDMQNKLNVKYHDFVIDAEREQLIFVIQEVED